MKVRQRDRERLRICLRVHFSYHSLHFFGDLVAPQVVIKWPVGPVWAVVGDAVCPLPIHLGNHGLFFFLLEGIFICNGIQASVLFIYKIISHDVTDVQFILVFNNMVHKTYTMTCQLCTFVKQYSTNQKLGNTYSFTGFSLFGLFSAIVKHQKYENNT